MSNVMDDRMDADAKLEEHVERLLSFTKPPKTVMLLFSGLLLILGVLIFLHPLLITSLPPNPWPDAIEYGSLCILVATEPFVPYVVVTRLVRRVSFGFAYRMGGITLMMICMAPMVVMFVNFSLGHATTMNAIAIGVVASGNVMLGLSFLWGFRLYTQSGAFEEAERRLGLQRGIEQAFER